MKLAVLASGSGTILEAMLAGGLPVGLVGVDRPCRATAIADSAGVEWFCSTRSFGDDFDREAYTEEFTQRLVSADVDLVVMAGFGTIFGSAIYERFTGRVVNTHPSLLPSFPGWHAVDDAMAHGVKVTGCTVHVAELEVDAGPILAQEAVAVLDDDTVESLHERIKVVERRLYLDTVRAIIERGWVLPDQRSETNDG